MPRPYLRPLAPLLVAGNLSLAACPLDPSSLGELPDDGASDGDPGETLSENLSTTTGDIGPTTGAPITSGEPMTTGGTTGGEPLLPEPACRNYGACNQLDVLFVVDNSGTMGEEQSQLADSFPAFVTLLRGLKDIHGDTVGADVHIMVTTTDVPHPLCEPFEAPDYDAADGAPIDTPCTQRLNRFTGLGSDPVTMPEVCTKRCPSNSPTAPSDPYIRFDPAGHNVIDPDGLGDPAADALACIGPQGIDGCGMESPLEAMLRALNPESRWNTGEKPFLRDGAPLAVILVTDETDCSTLDFNYFDPTAKDDPEYSKYWPPDPASGLVKEPTSAVCWNAGITCDDADQDGIYESCMCEDKGVLQPLSRYRDLLAQTMLAKHGKEVMMLVIGGVPRVTEHAEEPPFQPTAGGVDDLVYRNWTPADILPGDTDSAAQKQYEFGIGPGCIGPAGQAVPPGRIQEVCQGLDVVDDPDTAVDETAQRCCIESVCDADYTAALTCLTGMLRPALRASR